MLYLNTSNYVKVDGMTNAVTGDIISNAVVKLSLKNENETLVEGENFPVTMTPIVGESGAYEYTLSSDITLVEYDKYIAEIEVTSQGAKLTGYYDVRAMKFDFGE